MKFKISILILQLGVTTRVFIVEISDYNFLWRFYLLANWYGSL